MDNLFRFITTGNQELRRILFEIQRDVVFCSSKYMCQFIGVLKNVHKYIFIKIQSSTQIKKMKLKISEEEDFRRQIIKYENNQIICLINFIKTFSILPVCRSNLLRFEISLLYVFFTFEICI